MYDLLCTLFKCNHKLLKGIKKVSCQKDKTCKQLCRTICRVSLGNVTNDSMSVDVSEIGNLAKVLQEHGDRILNGTSKLSVNAELLQTISGQFNNYCDNTQSDASSATFRVLSPHHGPSSTLHHLEFLHDFFQKTMGLKIIRNSSRPLSDQKIDLSSFRNLKYLELKRVPVKHLIGLKMVQPYLECIICERSLTALEQLLAECGGDNATGFVWSELKEAVLSFNEIKVVDTSVAFAPWLQVLDLSHNQITDVKAIECLPNLKYVNLSFNSLTVIPIFNKSARTKIEILVLKNNYIEDLHALSELNCLHELDLSDNRISKSESFYVFLKMSTLVWLSLQDNPIYLLPNYRASLIGYLHINASFRKVVLDRVALSKQEQTRVGIELVSHSQRSRFSVSVPIEEADTATAGPSIDYSESEKLLEKSNRKSGKVRLTVIPNLTDGTYEDVASDLNNISVLKESSTVHLETKKIIADAREKYGEDWLRSSAVGGIQDILGLPPSNLSSTPYDDACVEAILKDVILEPKSMIGHTSQISNTTITTAVIEPRPHDCESIDEKSISQNINDSFLSCNDNASAYFSIDGSLNEQKESKETSPDIETIVDSAEEGDENHENIFCCIRLIKIGNEYSSHEVFLSVTATEFHERDAIHGRLVATWSLTSLESISRPTDQKLHIFFDSIRRDRRERMYELEPADAANLCYMFQTVLQKRKVGNMANAKHLCVTCSTSFIVEDHVQKFNLQIVCPACGSKMVIQADEAAPIDDRKAAKISKQPPSRKHSHNRSASTGIVDSLITQDINKCSSHSSIGSAVSLDDSRLTLPAILTLMETKCESDIEIISNPSQSSIEVIDTSRQHDVASPQRRLSVEETQITLASVVSAVSAFTGLTESSSSGSGTDSVCTAYENNSMVSSGVSKKSGMESSVLIEDPVAESFQNETVMKKDFEKILAEVLQSVEVNEQKPIRKNVDKDVDVVEYSFHNFDQLDHRIKLYIYAHLFKDNSEELTFLIRCQVLPLGMDYSYNACVVCSTKKLYVLKITGPEEGEEASKFLSKVDSLSINLANVKTWGTLAWYQGFSVTFRSQPSEYLILLKNPTWTNNFLGFLKASGSALPSSIEINTDPISVPNLRLCQLLLVAEDTSLLNIAFFIESRITEGNAVIKECQEGAVIVTSSDLYIVSSLTWLFNSTKSSPPSLAYVQKLSDLIQAGVNEKEMRLQFLQEDQGKEEIWMLSLASEEVVQQLIQAIKVPWEHLFSIPLHVSSDSF